MRALDRKLLRDLARMRAQVATVATVVACGVAIFVTALGSYHSLLHAQQSYYQETRFAELFAGLKRAPLWLAAELAGLPGVAQLEVRLVHDVSIDLPGLDLPVSGRVIGLPEHGEAKLNLLHVRRGRQVEPGAADEILLSEGFARANGLDPGSRIFAVLNGKRQAFRVVGIVLSPEYIFATAAGSPIPDDQRFGVFWMNHEPLAAALDMIGAFNDVALTLAPGAQPKAVMAELDRLLDPYGGLIAHERGEQASHRFLADEITQQGIMAMTIPAIFLVVAAYLLNVVMSRIVTTQREQVAALKALGYPTATIAGHYLKFVSVVALSGGVGGSVLGIGLGQLSMASYVMFFRFPVLEFHPEPWVMPLAVGIGLAAALSGALAAVRAVVVLPPAVAMRPPPPRYQGTVIEGLGWFRGWSPRRLMPLRGIAGRPVRAVLASLGMALAVPIIVLSLFWRDALDYMVAVQFAAAERSDAVLTFTDPLAYRALRQVAHMPGVLRAEATRTVPVRLQAGHRTYRTAISGLDPDAQLRRLLDRQLRPLPLPPDGLLLSRRLAERIGVAPGDRLMVEVLDGRRPRRQVPVAGLVDDMIGVGAYMRLGTLNRLMGEGDAVSSVAVTLDAGEAAAFYRQLKALPKIQTVTIKAAAIESFRATTATFVLFLATLFSFFGATIAVGVVYNNARVALEERSWELASLRVLGFTRAEVARMLLSELAIEVAVGIPLGLLLGHAMVHGLVALHATEMFEIPPAVSPGSYALAAGIVLGAALASAALVRRRIDRLDLLAVLKTRE